MIHDKSFLSGDGEKTVPVTNSVASAGIKKAAGAACGL
jgi:hypothetical protein